MSVSSGSRTVTSRFSDRLETKGNGCAGIHRQRRHQRKNILDIMIRGLGALLLGLQCSYVTQVGGRLRSAWPAIRAAPARWRVLDLARPARSIRQSAAADVRPSGVSSCIPATTCCFRPPIRFMKNSSRLRCVMARNFTPLQQRIALSAASARTRWLNASHVSSRLRYNSGAFNSGSIFRSRALPDRSIPAADPSLYPCRCAAEL